MEGDEMLTVEDVANLLRVSEATIKKWAAAGKLPAMKIGRLWRFRRSSIEEFIHEQENRPRTS